MNLSFALLYQTKKETPGRTDQSHSQTVGSSGGSPERERGRTGTLPVERMSRRWFSSSARLTPAIALKPRLIDNL